MKTWNTPVVEEMNFSETQHGGSATVKMDYIYTEREKFPGEEVPAATWES